MITFFGAAFEMGAGFVDRQKDSGRLNDDISAVVAPGDFSWLLLGIDRDLVTFDDEFVAVFADGAFEAAVGRIVAQQIDHVIEIHERIIDAGHDNVRILQRRTKDQTTDTTETVDSQLHFGHDENEQERAKSKSLKRFLVLEICRGSR
jgi:hypothetical protein